MAKNILVPVADGIEELEAITIIDILRRAGVHTRVSSIGEKMVIAANEVKITADSKFSDENIDDFYGIVLPGGTRGAENFSKNINLTDALKKFAKNQKLVAAICASPALVLEKCGILEGKKATCYPYFKDKIKNFVDDPVVVDGNIVTSQGPGTALLFALKLVEILTDIETATKIRKDILFK